MSTYLEGLREVAGMGGPAAVLANDLLVFEQQRASGELNEEEYQYLVQEVANVRAQQELANDEAACRYIIAAAIALSQLV